MDALPDYDTPRSHSPRKALDTCVIAVYGLKKPFRAFIVYHPEQDKCYDLLNRAQPETTRGHAVAYGGKLFFVPKKDTDEARCYDPDLNRWSPAPWTKADSNPKFITAPRFFTAV